MMESRESMYKVLIAEDEEIIRRGLIFSQNWQELDCTVISECSNGEEGIKAIIKYCPDIVITDINMPVVDGLEMIRQTYEQVEYSAIILSGYSNFEYAQTAIQYGVLGYLLKPLKRNEIITAVEKAKIERYKRIAYYEHKYSAEKLTTNFMEETEIVYSGEDTLVKHMLDYVKEHYNQKIVMKDVVREMNYSDTFLNKKFKEATGTTFIEYVNRYRIRQAIFMMSEQKLSVQDVAWRCGIVEYKYFNIVFKKYLCCSPKEYTAMLQDKYEG
jgi:two-component system response regulator YesN